MVDIVQGSGPGFQNPQIKYRDMGDGTHAEVVYVGGGVAGGGGEGVDREVVVTVYRATASGTGFNVNDTITATRVLDVSGASATQVGATVWYNESTAAVLASAPAASSLTIAGAPSLTDAQLRASRVNVEPLGIPGTARQQATTTTSANIALTSGVARISVFARLQPLRYLVGSSSQTANNATSHYLAAGERIDIDVPATPNIAVIRASDATGDGAAEITELS